MRKSLVLVLVAFASSAYSQVAFQNISFADALSQSKEKGKLIFLQLESPDCRQCTEVANKGLSDKDLSSTINQSFIPLYVDAKHKDRKEIETQYNLPDGFGTLFIDQSGTLIHKFSGTVSMPQKYREQIEIALSKAGESLKVSDLEKEYRNGNKSVGFLEQLLLKKKALNLNTTVLLDEYISLLPADSLSSSYTLQFIAGMAPLLGSRADATLRKDRALFNQAWYNMPLNKRININAWIIQNSLNKAVLENDKAYAFRVASFAKGTITGNPAAAEKAYYMRLLEFYERVDDTANYFSTAVHYYDTYLMTIDADSIKQVDKVILEKLSGTAKKDTIKTDKGFTIKSTVAYAPIAQRYTWDLKEGAWNFYKKTNNPTLLAMATDWIKKALLFSETPEALDVYAHLLYKQQQKEQAIEIEKRTIELKKKQGFSVSDNEDELSLMQKGLALNN